MGWCWQNGYCRAMGFTDYTIVVLPMSLIGQACFLSAALGDDAAWIDGKSTTQTGKIGLLTPETFLQPLTGIMLP